MAAVDFLTNTWKEWSLQVLVLLSLTLQVMLLILAEFRRHIDCGVLRALVWSAYMLADTTAIYVLGHLSVTSMSPEHELMALWVPFLLLHLGGQDNITAYAIEDKKLWLRHLQTLVVQFAAAAYVLYGFSTIIGDGRSLLLPATMLVSLAGAVKYGERVWALRCDSCRPTQGYDEPNYVGPSADSLEFLDSPAFTSRSDPEASLLKAHLLIDLAKGFFRWGPLADLVIYTTPASQLDRGNQQDEVYKVVKMQMSLIHDLFYTKVEVMHTWYGFCIRILALLATTIAFLLFNTLLLGSRYRKLMNGGYSRVDVVVTYVLFVGAIVLDCMSLFRAMYSTWTCILLIEWRRDRYGEPDEISRLRRVELTVCEFLARVLVYLRRMVRVAEWRRRCSWSRSMGQQNLIRLCTRSRSSRSTRMARWMGVADRWNTIAYSWSVPVSECVKRQLLKSIQQLHDDSLEEIHGHIIAGENAGVDLQARHWGIGAITRTGLHESLAWSVRFKVEESILIWHIATDIYLWWCKQQDKKEKERGASRGDDDDDDNLALAETASALSNYMLFLLAARPHMLPPDASRDPYVHACYDLAGLECSSAEDLLTLLGRYAEALRGGSDEPELFPCDVLRINKTLPQGCRLGALLIGQQDMAAVGGRDNKLLEMICLVWADMLCYVGHGCSADSHVKQLSGGGELLTLAALIAKYATSIEESS